MQLCAHEIHKLALYIFDKLQQVFLTLHERLWFIIHKSIAGTLSMMIKIINARFYREI